MNVQANEFELKMTHGEFWDLAFDVKKALIATAKDHWVNHQSSWKENEKHRMNRLKTFFTALGQPHFYESIEKEVQEIFDEFNKKRKP